MTPLRGSNLGMSIHRCGGSRVLTDALEAPGQLPARQKMFYGGVTFQAFATSDSESMRRLQSILTLLLLAASAMSLLAAQGSTVPGIHDEKPAGCHEHGKKAPVHPASDYACCVAGHGSAVVQASCVPQGQQVSIGFVLTAPSLQPPELYGVAVLQTYSGTPPHQTPLRI
jgi:hypothetical protein